MTLIELLSVVVVAGLIAVVGIPSMNTYVNHGRAVIAIGDIGNISGLLYRWQLNTRAFPETLAEAGLDGRLDPWGHPYRYLKIDNAQPTDRRLDPNLRAINTDFDIYSLGPDGETQTEIMAPQARDDVIRGNNGRFIGVAENY
ncbi:MAG TPA: prepilin-type cleavage/methylation domain-containing protein [Gammaproteobacteria bacterium]|nr:prepilin-type cleavage/methylation domain-containing protein [Gammaproteobacteria bacterium]